MCFIYFLEEVFHFGGRFKHHVVAVIWTSAWRCVAWKIYAGIVYPKGRTKGCYSLEISYVWGRGLGLGVRYRGTKMGDIASYLASEILLDEHSNMIYPF
jgi:hypothetical protein